MLKALIICATGAWSQITCAAFAFPGLKPRHFGKIFGANAGRYWIVTYSLESALVTSTGRATLT